MSQIPPDFVIELIGLFQQGASINSWVPKADEKGIVSKKKSFSVTGFLTLCVFCQASFSRSAFACACIGCIFALCTVQVELHTFPGKRE